MSVASACDSGSTQHIDLRCASLTHAQLAQRATQCSGVRRRCLPHSPTPRLLGAADGAQVLWYGDRYIGTNLPRVGKGFAAIAEAMGAEGIRVDSADQVGPALQQAIDAQMNDGKTTVIEVMTTRELGDPFRRDAMKLPVRRLAKYQPFTEVNESATGQPVDIQAGSAPSAH